MSVTAIDRGQAPPIARSSSPPRRVCLVTEAAGGGVGRHFLDLAKGLAARGVEVVAIFSPDRCDASFRERRQSISGVRCVELPMRRAVHPVDAFDLARLISRIRNEGRFDIIHGHSSKGGALARLAARWLGVPAVYTPHALVTLDPMLSAVKRRIYGAVERWLALRSAALIAVSDDEAAHARALGIDANKIHVVHNGLETPAFPPREAARSRLNLLPDDFVVGFVGRLASQKAPEVLVEAVALLMRQFSRARLVMVGDGPLEAFIRRRIEEFGLAERARLLGDVVGTSIMPALDVFCLPSRYEGLPYVLIEALSAGLPIVASRVGGVATCVEPDRNGIIVQSGNAAALAAALAALAADPLARRRYAAASAAKAVQFSLDRMIDQTWAVYGRAWTLAAHVAGRTATS